MYYGLILTKLTCDSSIRVCPGIYLADRVGFQVATAAAALYKIVPLEGRSRPDPESVKYTDALVK